ncbi:MAG: hypothetical protein RRC34_16530, partial [Lentisphaeria bacterium]|nr:hypothetical protein [Lentisphaeria bacterium]
MELVSGDFIVVNAGDDVSLPERTEALVEIWLSSREKVKLVHSATLRIDEHGNSLRYRAPRTEMQQDITPDQIIIKCLCVIGATAGWTRDVFLNFGPLGESLLNEDHIIPFRAAILGSIEYTPDALVKHREGGVSACAGRGPGHEYLYGFSHKSRLWDYLVDLHILKSSLNYTYPKKNEVEKVCRVRTQTMRFMIDLAETPKLKRWGLLPRAVRLSRKHQQLSPLKNWARYTFDVLYMKYVDWRAARKI